MTTLTSLVTVKGKEYDENDHLINFLDIMSLKTWSYMRRCAIDYGRNYRRRVEYAAVIVSICSFLTGVYLIVLYVLGQKNPFLLATVIVVLKLVILIGILLVNFISSACVNEAFLSQKAACLKINLLGSLWWRDMQDSRISKIWFLKKDLFRSTSKCIFGIES